MQVVLATAGKLIPYQRPTYRSVEVRDGRESEQRRRIFDNPREELGRMIVGAVLAVQAKEPIEPVEPAPSGKCVAEAMGRPRCTVQCENPRDCTATVEPVRAVDNGDGVIS
jgi:hypothetical protein